MKEEQDNKRLTTISVEVDHGKFVERKIKTEIDTPYLIVNTELNFEIATKLGPSCMLLYQVLLSHRNTYNNKCFPSIKVLVKETGLSENTIKTNLTKLHNHGYIVINSGMRGINSNYYFPCEWFYKYFIDDICQRKASRRKGKKKSVTEKRETKEVKQLKSEIEDKDKMIAELNQKLRESEINNSNFYLDCDEEDF